MLRIFLDHSSFDCLLKSIPHESIARPTLYGTVLLGNTRVIECTAAEARELLMVACVSCPTAVDRITEALRVIGLEPT